jgi:hypothetical protein
MGKVGEGRPVFLGIALNRPFDALEEDTRFLIPMLVGVYDIPAVFVDPAGDPGHDTRLIRSPQKGD